MRKSFSFYSKLLSITGLCLILLPLFEWWLWIKVFNSNPEVSQSVKLKIYLSYFPEFMRSGDAHQSAVNMTLNSCYMCLAAIVMSIAAIILISLNKETSNKILIKIISGITAVIALLLVLLNIFTLL